MSRLAWFTALALTATTSVAVAQGYDYDAQRRDANRGWFTRHIPYEYDRDRNGVDDRYERNSWERDRWVPIAQSYSAATDKQSIAVTRPGRFDKIRVQAVRGAPVIHKIAIEFQGDPNVQAIEMNRRLAPGAGEVIRLNGGNRQIRRIVVYSEPSYRGSYSIFAG